LLLKKLSSFSDRKSYFEFSNRNRDHRYELRLEDEFSKLNALSVFILSQEFSRDELFYSSISDLIADSKGTHKFLFLCALRVINNLKNGRVLNRINLKLIDLQRQKFFFKYPLKILNRCSLRTFREKLQLTPGFVSARRRRFFYRL